MYVKKIQTGPAVHVKQKTSFQKRSQILPSEINRYRYSVGPVLYKYKHEVGEMDILIYRDPVIRSVWREFNGAKNQIN